MGKPSRDKGQRGERELLALLSDRLGTICRRNLIQSRAGGADCIDLPGWTLEVKRAEVLRLPEWWAQACDQAEIHGGVPVLAFRQSRRRWGFLVPLHVIMGYGWAREPIERAAALTLEGFCEVVRERIERESQP